MNETGAKKPRVRPIGRTHIRFPERDNGYMRIVPIATLKLRREGNDFWCDAAYVSRAVFDEVVSVLENLQEKT